MICIGTGARSVTFTSPTANWMAKTTLTRREKRTTRGAGRSMRTIAAAARDDVMATVADISRRRTRYIQPIQCRKDRFRLRFVPVCVFEKNGRVEQLAEPAKLQPAHRQFAAFRSHNADPITALAQRFKGLFCAVKWSGD